MGSYIARRLLLLFPILIGVTLISFGLIYLAPGDPAIVMLRAQGVQQITEQNLERLRIEMGLNDPVATQYVRWLGRVVQLDFGKSVRTGTPVAELIIERLWLTIQLALISIGLAVAIAVPVGIVAAVKQHSLLDHLGRIFALAGASMPSFWLALLLIFAVAVRLGWLPALGQGTPAHFVLPALTLSLGVAPLYARLLRASMLDVLKKPYVTTARAKGVVERSVILHHSLRNALIPFVTVFGTSFAHLLGGAVVVETIFAWPGVGKLVVDAILTRDYPVVQAFVLVSALIFVLTNLLVDLSYRLLDPRIRLEGDVR